MVTFVQSYSYNRPFDGSHNVEVALSENEFDTPALTKLGFTAVNTFVSHYQDESGMYCVFL